MADKSAIEWTDATWSPVTGCDPISPGCKYCYAKREVEQRWSKNPRSVWFGRPFNDVRCHYDQLEVPLRWKKPTRIFVCPRADLFHETVPDEFIDKVFAAMAMAPQHTFQILTKRPERMQFLLWSEFDWKPLPNVWIGVSIEDQATADERIPLLMQTPAAIRWVSVEPLLGPVDLFHVRDGQFTFNALSKKEGIAYRSTGLDWVVVGGESGPKARPMHPHWARSLRDQCAAAGVPFLLKQWGEWIPIESEDNGEGRVWFPATSEDREPDECAPFAGIKARLIEAHDMEFARVGKKRAGRLLDGELHDAYPEVRHA